MREAHPYAPFFSLSSFKTGLLPPKETPCDRPLVFKRCRGGLQDQSLGLLTKVEGLCHGSAPTSDPRSRLQRAPVLVWGWREARVRAGHGQRASTPPKPQPQFQPNPCPRILPAPLPRNNHQTRPLLTALANIKLTRDRDSMLSCLTNMTAKDEHGAMARKGTSASVDHTIIGELPK